MARLSLKTDFKDGQILYGDELNTCNKATNLAVTDNYEKILELQTLKADVTDVTSKLATKVDVNTFNDSINSLNATKADLSLVNTKADKSELETKANKSDVEQSLATKAGIDYVNNQLTVKADKSSVDAALNLKADKSDTYTKEETDVAITVAGSKKADLSYVNTQLNSKANTSAVGDTSKLKTTNKVVVDAINELKTEGSDVNNIDYKTITKNTQNAIQAVGVVDNNDMTVAVKTWTGTKEEYDALEIKESNTLYYITDDYEEPEVKSNKVTDINSTNTDEEYPSAKAVYDAIQDVSGGGGDIPIATTEVAGKVKPDGTTITVDTDGTIHSVGGSGGTNNYELLINKPQINGFTLLGNKTNADLGIKQNYTADDITFSDGETFQDKYDAGELTGPQGAAGEQGPKGDTGDTGPQGETGPAGANATINGQNTLNILAGTNITLDQQGTDLTINATGGSSGGATYTAGTNIEITDDNVINNTTPIIYDKAGNYVSLGKTSKDTNFTNSTVIGVLAKVNNWGTAIGYGASAMKTNGIAIGILASCDEANECRFGSNVSKTNKITMYTSEGIKTVATTDQIPSSEALLPSGGTTGQVLMKTSDSDYAVAWTDLNNLDEVSF